MKSKEVDISKANWFRILREKEFDELDQIKASLVEYFTNKQGYGNFTDVSIQKRGEEFIYKQGMIKLSKSSWQIFILYRSKYEPKTGNDFNNGPEVERGLAVFIDGEETSRLVEGIVKDIPLLREFDGSFISKKEMSKVYEFERRINAKYKKSLLLP